jgi:hypothetical protein
MFLPHRHLRTYWLLMRTNVFVLTKTGAMLAYCLREVTAVPLLCIFFMNTNNKITAERPVTKLVRTNQVWVTDLFGYNC